MNRNLSNIRIVVLSILVILCVSTFLVSQTAKGESSNDGKSLSYLERIDKAHDYAFPINHGSPIDTRFSIALRYLPSSYPTSQIVFRYGSDSAVSIDYMEAADQVDRLIISGESDVLKLANLLGVKTTHLQMTSDEFMPCFEGLWDAISKSTIYLQKEVMLSVFHADGAEYVLEFSAKRSSFRIRTQGSHLLSGPTPNDPPIVKWMVSIHREIKRRLQDLHQKRAE